MARRSSLWAVVGWLCIAGEAALAIAAEEAPLPGKSKIVAAPFLKKVETFRRKVVFFSKDVDLPFLKVPEPGERTAILFHGVVGSGEDVSGRVIMSKDGELLLCAGMKILRASKEGPPEVLVRLAELTIAGTDKRPERLHFDQLVAASATKDILYVALSDTGRPDGRTHSYAENAFFLGKLDRAARRLALAKVALPSHLDVDPEAGFIYQAGTGLIERTDFEGKQVKQWRLPGGPDYEPLPPGCRLSPNRQSLLLSRPTFSSNSWREHLTVLDLGTGRESVLPIKGRAPAWGSDGVIFFLQEAEGEGGILETSLFRLQIGQKEPSRLFWVSCKRVERLDSLLGTAPDLSADRSWLAWQLPVEYSESGTILVDLTSQEYRILGGRWSGVQLFYR
jgi:hypothetical protein